MKKLLLAAAALLCATAITVQAQDAASGDKKAKKELTTEQKQLQTDMLAKYDTNKDGKLDKEEKAAMSQEDKDAWAKAFPGKKKKKGGEGATAPKADDAAAPKAGDGK
jgi:Ni/Co efflux regulator RcnB